jgi:hypothetical protein
MKSRELTVGELKIKIGQNCQLLSNCRRKRDIMTILASSFPFGRVDRVLT